MKAARSLVIRCANVARPTIRERIYFLHVPKCGGTSLGRAIRERYESLRFRDRDELRHLDAKASVDAVCIADNLSFNALSTEDYAILRFREHLAAYYLSQPCMRYVQAHSPFNEHVYREFGDRFAFITLLRDPVRMWLSAYNYNRHRPRDRRTHELGLEEYLSTDMAKAVGYQYVKFLGGTRRAGDYTSTEAVEQAKRNLERFALVGVLENPRDMLDRFHQRFGVRLRLPHKNVSPTPGKGPALTHSAEANARIEEICAPNREIYEFAQARFVSKPA